MISKEALKQILENFQPRRKDAIGDRSVLMALIGMLCNLPQSGLECRHHLHTDCSNGLVPPLCTLLGIIEFNG